MLTVYLGFSSSNFFWENLEKTASTFEEFKAVDQKGQAMVVSLSGSTDSFYTSTSTQVLYSYPLLTNKFSGMAITNTGSTIQINFNK